MLIVLQVVNNKVTRSLLTAHCGYCCDCCFHGHKNASMSVATRSRKHSDFSTKQAQSQLVKAQWSSNGNGTTTWFECPFGIGIRCLHGRAISQSVICNVPPAYRSKFLEFVNRAESHFASCLDIIWCLTTSIL
jgi:hypothetical protein